MKPWPILPSHYENCPCHRLKLHGVGNRKKKKKQPENIMCTCTQEVLKSQKCFKN